MDLTTFIGLVAGTLTTIAFLPQLTKILKTRSTKDVSTAMFIIFSTGVLLWLIYGLLIHSIPVIIANAITLALASVILFLKVKFG
ncbi:MAG: SemiSWEET transporter [Nitrospira sp.]